MDKIEQVKQDAQQNWVIQWDKANPSNFVKECNASRARQEDALYLKQQKERLQNSIFTIKIKR
jgi:hypothetical protein